MRYTCLAAALVAVFMMSGCGDDDPSSVASPPTPTPTAVPMVPTAATPPVGPKITFMGITRADDVLVERIETSPEGVPVYTRLAGATGGASGFRLVIEGKPGPNGRPVAPLTFDADNASMLADLQIQTNRALGNGSAAVCDVVEPTPAPAPGGVPAISPPSFDSVAANIDKINDLSCRFRDGQGATMAVGSPGDACVKMEPTEEYGFVDSTSTTQFCGFISALLTFSPGDTLLTARLRDDAGNVGAPAQMIIRVH